MINVRCPSVPGRCRWAGVLVALGLLCSLGACSGDEQRTTTVLAAASLTDVFTQLGSEYENQNPGESVEFSFGSSATLAVQIAEGAPADVFAAADERSVGLLGKPVDDLALTIFATNQLQIAVPRGNPANVIDLAAFADASLRIAYCAEQAPCGKAAEKVFAAGKITPAPDSLEPDARATLTKVSTGEVDAALVYRTDVLAAGETVEGIDFAEADAATNRYPIVDLGSETSANGFVEYLLSPQGRSALADAGFGPA